MFTTGELGTAIDSVNYTYGDEDWGDLLTAYDGNTITYDGIGNPLSDGTWTYTWKHGRLLQKMSSEDATWWYSYDANGMRTRSFDGYQMYIYVYNGSRLVQLKKAADWLYFSYDPNGIPQTVTHNGTVYHYITNQQGDVIGIQNYWGDIVVEYSYNAWGELISITGTMAETLGTLNPLTYRGYVYDHETGLYYLQSRYYNPQTGRFLNADAVTDTSGLLGNNMFAYCSNNAVNYYDPTGYYLADVMRDRITTGNGVGRPASGPPKYIKDQSDYGIGNRQLGIATVSHGGCGVVASYNALITLGDAKYFSEVLSYFNGKFGSRLVLGGVAGISPETVVDYFENLGYSVAVTDDRDGIDLYSKVADASILWYAWPSGSLIPPFYAHFVESHRYGTGHIIYNTGTGKGTKVVSDLSDFLYDGENFMVTGIFIFK